MRLHRRNFIKSTFITGAGILVFNPFLKAFGSGKGVSSFTGIEGKWIPSACSGCTTWCPVQVFVQGGRAVKVRGNQYSETNPGAVCPRGHLGIHENYDPDRIKTPMKRTNTVKGKGINPGFVPITWDEAIDTIATKLMVLRAANETHKYLFLRGRYNFNTDIFYGRFNRIFGTPNAITHSSICAEAEKFGHKMTENIWGYRDYDLDNTKYLVLWGVDPFRSNRMVPSAMKNWQNVQKNAKMISIDPIMSGASAKAHKWLPIKPGEDGALAVAIAHQIMVKGLWHKPFVGDFNDGVNRFKVNQVVNESDFTEKYTYGIVKWWNIELKDKTPAWAETKCGIAVADIIQIAEEMGAKAPNVINWQGPGPVMSPRGAYISMAICALSGLLGATRNVGGIAKQPSRSTGSIKDPTTTAYPGGGANYTSDPATVAGYAKNKIDQKGTLRLPAFQSKAGDGSSINNVANAMLAANPYDIKVVIADFININFSGQNPQRWDEALKAPFLALMTTHANEMSDFADILLPAAHSGMERWGWLRTWSNRKNEVALQSPCAKRLFDVKDPETEIAWLLAKKLKEKGFPHIFDFYQQQILHPVSLQPAANESQFEEIVTRNYLHTTYTADGLDWDAFKEKGVAASSQASYFQDWQNFGTKTKKYEFYSETFKDQLVAFAAAQATTVDGVMEACNYLARGEQAYIPHYEGPLRHGDRATYPFDFVDIKSRFNREGRSSNLPFYYQFKKLDPGDINWDDAVKINPADAERLGIKQGDKVKITSVSGEITCTASLFEGVRPGTVGKCYGQGHHRYGRFSSKNFTTPNGGNNNIILPDEYERLSASSCRNGGFCGVKIQKV